MDVQSVATGLVVGVVVALVTFRLSISMERERWRREDRIRRENLERQTAERWANERRELYGRLLRLADDLRGSARDLYDRATLAKGWHDAWDESYQVAMEITLIDDALGGLAEVLSASATNYLGEAANWDQGALPDVKQPDLDEREQALNAAYEAFMAAAQANLRPATRIEPPAR